MMGYGASLDAADAGLKENRTEEGVCRAGEEVAETSFLAAQDLILKVRFNRPATRLKNESTTIFEWNAAATVF